jgi:hypothetical protein
MTRIYGRELVWGTGTSENLHLPFRDDHSSVPHSPVRPVRSTVLIWTASCSPVRELAQDQQSSGGALTRPPAGDPDDWILQRSKVLQKDFIIFIYKPRAPRYPPRSKPIYRYSTVPPLSCRIQSSFWRRSKVVA